MYAANRLMDKEKRYLLIDACAGTVDVCARETVTDLNLKGNRNENKKPKFAMKKIIFTKNAMCHFKNASPNVFTELLLNSRSANQSFGEKT